MATNEILLFASTNTGTNLLTQAEYAADAQRTTGNQPGIARSKLVNKALRQASLISAGVAEFIADNQSNNITDSLTAQNIADYLALAIQQIIVIPDQVPAGSVMYVSRSLPPTGYLKANGAAVSRTTYAALFAAIGTTYGAGDGSTTFNLPDLRGEFLRALDDGRGVDSGRTLGSAQSDAFQGHYHTSYPVCGQAGVTGDFRPTAGSGSGGTTDRYAMEPTVGSNGTPRVANETRPRNVALLACIKF